MSGMQIPELTATVNLDENFPRTLLIPELPSSAEEEDKLLGSFDSPTRTDDNNMEQEIAPNNNIRQAANNNNSVPNQIKYFDSKPK